MLRPDYLPEPSPLTFPNRRTGPPSTPRVAILREFPSLTQSPDRSLPVAHEVVHHVETTCPPVFAQPWCLHHERLKIAQAEFEHVLSIDVVRPSSSDWSSASNMVPKKTGNWRPCGDYRALNLVIVPYHYPLPRLQDFTVNLHGTTLCSKIDLMKAYHQIPVAASDIEKTTITKPFGLFEFPRGPRTAAARSPEQAAIPYDADESAEMPRDRRSSAQASPRAHLSPEPVLRETKQLSALEMEDSGAVPPLLAAEIPTEQPIHLPDEGFEQAGIPEAEITHEEVSLREEPERQTQAPYSPAKVPQSPPPVYPSAKRARQEPSITPKEAAISQGRSWKPSYGFVMQHINYALQLETHVLHGPGAPEQDIIPFNHLVVRDTFTRWTAAGWFSALLDMHEHRLIHLTQDDQEEYSSSLYGAIYIQKLP
ncbi:uncharacterized protein LOC135400482 [Ornithodoros turicata]|uniref:uncharacterized protein LOC135400482 n=1 Tax=Ornithodoros turicata TaxID=34597 RepID=UPI0031386F8F